MILYSTHSSEIDIYISFMVITGFVRFKNGNYVIMVPDLWQLQASYADREELAQPFSGLPPLIVDVLCVDVVDTQGLAYPQQFDGQLSFACSEVIS